MNVLHVVFWGTLLMYICVLCVDYIVTSLIYIYIYKDPLKKVYIYIYINVMYDICDSMFQ